MISTLEELEAAVELEDIRYQELSARRTGEPAPAKPVKMDLPMNLRVVWNDDQMGFAVLFKTTIKLPHAEFTVSVSVHFGLDTPSEVSDELMQGFLGDTAFNAAYPYIRQAASSMSSQLRISPIIMLPLMKSEVGQKLDVQKSPDQSPSGEDS